MPLDCSARAGSSKAEIQPHNVEKAMKLAQNLQRLDGLGTVEQRLFYSPASLYKEQESSLGISFVIYLFFNFKDSSFPISVTNNFISRTKVLCTLPMGQIHKYFM